METLLFTYSFFQIFQNVKVGGFETFSSRTPLRSNIIKDPNSEKVKEHLKNGFDLRNLQRCAHYILRAAGLGNYV